MRTKGEEGTGAFGMSAAKPGCTIGNNIAPKHKMLFMFIDQWCWTECEW